MADPLGVGNCAHLLLVSDYSMSCPLMGLQEYSRPALLAGVQFLEPPQILKPADVEIRQEWISGLFKLLKATGAVLWLAFRAFLKLREAAHTLCKPQKATQSNIKATSGCCQKTRSLNCSRVHSLQKASGPDQSIAPIGFGECRGRFVPAGVKSTDAEPVDNEGFQWPLKKDLSGGGGGECEILAQRYFAFCSLPYPVTSFLQV